jgi:hypothetical protein
MYTYTYIYVYMCRYDNAHLARMYYEHLKSQKTETWPMTYVP